MLEIKNLFSSVENKQILKGVNLNVNPGELHVVMGPNGAGKSTLGSVLTGKEKFQVDSGEILFENKIINDSAPEDRACNGIFMSFQYPVAIPGVNNMYFLKEALNSQNKYNGKKELDSIEFLDEIKSKLRAVGLDESFIHRPVNDGFSGGEKKRNEILQMITLKPKLSILDETDSGLDIDALKIVAKGVNEYRNKKRSFILITHYQRMLNYLEPDFVHVLMGGRIVKTGDKTLAIKLEEKGYSWLENENLSTK
ncbi:MAG: Fe-S cluster assembly ATPase SufC [Candidatus Neomarinimicrobiota bacterium]|jgi:Fe-S cluster assembly ATP-binding protein|nr:Fe-S cluster assembly ATPase SufC [Candidatus Neomarinimicrobiota bacterium]